MSPSDYRKELTAKIIQQLGSRYGAVGQTLGSSPRSHGIAT